MEIAEPTVVEPEKGVATASVASSAKQCITSFQACLGKAASVHPRELSMVEDQLARFNIWAANIKAFAAGCDSLDHRLREAPDVQDNVIGLLEALEYRVDCCTGLLEPLAVDPAAEVEEPLPPLSEELQYALQKIQDEISLLHKFTNTIRKASRAAQNQKVANEFRIRDDEGNDTEPFLQELFANYIRDRFRGVDHVIRQRLASTMVQRRKRILYRRARFGNTAIRLPETTSQPSITLPKVAPTAPRQDQDLSRYRVSASAAAKPQSTVQSLAQTATTLSPESFKKASAPSVMSVAKTVALSGHEELRFPPCPGAGILRKLHKAKAEREASHRARVESRFALDEHLGRRLELDEAPTAAGVARRTSLETDWIECLEEMGEVICPFCFYTLPARDAVDEHKWKVHVLNDLDPYVCLATTCDAANELFSHSHTWLKHMREHALTWRCVSKSHAEFVASTRAEYLAHMESAHPRKFNPAQLAVLADLNGRTIGPLFKSCPLCGLGEVTGSTMEDHIVGHLRSLALQSLPSYEANMAEQNDQISDQDSRSWSVPHTRSTIENDPKRGIALRFHSNGGSIAYYEHGRRHVESVPVIAEGENRRLLQWGFIPGLEGSSTPPAADPILCKFKLRSDGNIQTASQAQDEDVKPPSKSLNPDCAICHGPASLVPECQCEAKALEVAVRQAEAKVISPLVRDIRTWVRVRSQKFARSRWRDQVISMGTALPGLNADQRHVRHTDATIKHMEHQERDEDEIEKQSQQKQEVEKTHDLDMEDGQTKTKPLKPLNLAEGDAVLSEASLDHDEKSQKEAPPSQSSCETFVGTLGPTNEPLVQPNPEDVSTKHSRYDSLAQDNDNQGRASRGFLLRTPPLRNLLRDGEEMSEGTTAALQFPEAEVYRAWQEACQQLPEVLDYFFSLAEITLPNEDEPAVRDPPPPFRPPHPRPTGVPLPELWRAGESMVDEDGSSESSSNETGDNTDLESDEGYRGSGELEDEHSQERAGVD